MDAADGVFFNIILVAKQENFWNPKTKNLNSSRPRTLENADHIENNFSDSTNKNFS